MTIEKLTKEQVERIEKINSEISYFFTWKETEDGYEYWNNVCKALMRIAKNGLKNSEKKVCDKCGQELK